MFQRKPNACIVVCLGLFLKQQMAFVGAFSTPLATSYSRSSQAAATRLNMVTAASADNFFDDFHGDDSASSSSSSSSSFPSSSSVQQEYSSSSKFVTGDDLHRLRHQVLAMRLELQEARRSADLYSENDDNKQYYLQRIQDLEKAIMKTQQVDAEFVYTVSLERKELAERSGNMFEAQHYHERAMEARSALPQFNLEGLWVGKYGEHGYEMINVTYHGDILLAQKVTGTKNVPKGQVTFQVDLNPHGPGGALSGGDALSPIELGDSAANQWGCKYLQRFAGQGQVAAEGYQDSQWIDGQLIMVNDYFSFAWLPIGHQVFFGRPTPELILKLMKDEKKKEVGDCSARAFLERCWEETEHVEDDLEVHGDGIAMADSADRSYFYEEDAFQ